ncbi:MAG: hypothetical protein CMO01_18135 [Thalassobius sp.]|nr:hypothetical protein [Thalassovita sp.]
MKIENYHIEDFILDESFQRYFFGVNQEDEMFWEKWITENPNRLNDVQEAKKFLSNLQFETETLSDDELQEEILSMKNEILRSPNRKFIEPTQTKTNHTRRIAATITSLLIAGAIAYFFIGNTFTNQEESNKVVADYMIKSAPLGQKNAITLSDGSKIKLNAGSSLKIYPDFNKQDRKVILEGEAFFDVAENEQKPFIIESGDLVTTVKGTSFNIKSFQEDNTVYIAVAAGLVSVKKTLPDQKDSSDFEMLLQPDVMLVYQTETENFSRENFDRDLIFGWKDGVLSFKEANFQKIKIELERWYGAEIIINNQNVLNRPYTGTYKNASLETVLDGMRYVLGFSFEIKENKVYIN